MIIIARWTIGLSLIAALFNIIYCFNVEVTEPEPKLHKVDLPDINRIRPEELDRLDKNEFLITDTNEDGIIVADEVMEKIKDQFIASKQKGLADKLSDQKLIDHIISEDLKDQQTHMEGIVNKVMHKDDLNGDGKITYNEFSKGRRSHLLHMKKTMDEL